MSTLRIDNGFMVTLDAQQRCIESGSLLIEDGRIVALGANIGDESRPGRVIDAGGKVVMPGLINAHHHLYSTFARGYTPPGAPPENFEQILQRLWWKLDQALEPEDVYDSAVLALMEGAHAGCTTVIDHHASPGCCDGSLDAIERAFRDTGLSGCLCYEVSDRNVEGQGIGENLRFLRKCRDAGDDQLTSLFGLHALMTLGEATLERCEDIARAGDIGFHVHVAEDAIDVRLARERHGRHVVEVLADRGVTGPQSIFVHGVHLAPAELDILAATNSIVVNCPESNMNNAVGVADVPAMLERGIPVGLGTDGMSSNMLAQARAMYLQQRLVRQDPAAGFAEACRMLLEHNREICDRLFRDTRGVLVPGSLGDVIVYDYVPPTPLSGDTLYGHLLFGLAQARVHTTIARGEILVDGGRFVPLDEEGIRARCAERAPAIWRRAAS